MMKVDNELLSELLNFGRSASKKNLIWATSGNISHRMNDKTFLITKSGAYLEDLKRDDFVEVDVDGNVISGKSTPSLETKMHAAVYKIMPRINAVFHSQAFFTTLVSSTDLEIDSKLFPESVAYIKNIDRISYHHPGSSDLADEVAKKITSSDILILNNHGALCASETLENALIKTETLEMLSKMLIFSRISDVDLNFLSQELRDDLLKYLKKTKGPM